MRMPLIVLASAALLAVASTAAARTCLVEGDIRVNGNPIPQGEVVTCHHSGGTTVVESGVDGSYACAVESGSVFLELRGQTSPVCPAACEGACESVECDLDISGGPPGCLGSSAAEAALLLPPALVVPLVRRCRRRSAPASR